MLTLLLHVVFLSTIVLLSVLIGVFISPTYNFLADEVEGVTGTTKASVCWLEGVVASDCGDRGIVVGGVVKHKVAQLIVSYIVCFERLNDGLSGIFAYMSACELR